MLPLEIEPAEELRGAIKCFWYTTVDFGESESSFEIVPDGYAEIVFHFGSPCSVSYNGSVQPLPSPTLMGLLDQPVLLHSKNRLKVIGIRCFPWSAFDLLGLPSSKDGIHVFEHPIAQLQPTLMELVQAGQIIEALAQINQYFLHASTGVTSDRTVVKAGVAMQEAKGTLPVSQIASAAHATVRTLERKFKQSSGYTVKDVSGLMRFEQVRNQLWLHPDANLAGLAYELGYTDQAHLSREFKRYSGTTPAAFARKTKNRKLVVGNGLVAIV